MRIEPTKKDISSLEFILEERGQPISTQPLTPATLEKWHGILPNRLLYIWQELGWCAFREGLLWLVNPDDYAHIVQSWIEGTRIDRLDTYHCYARTAFGELMLYAEKNKRFLKIMPQHQTIWVNEKELIRSVKEGDTMMGIVLHGYEEDYDLVDKNNEGLYQQALAKLGALNADEMYTFVPFLMMLPDEKRVVDNLQRVRMDVQLDILRQLDEPTLRGTSYSDIYK